VLIQQWRYQRLDFPQPVAGMRPKLALQQSLHDLMDSQQDEHRLRLYVLGREWHVYDFQLLLLVVLF
jgi:hypothetical protein